MHIKQIIIQGFRNRQLNVVEAFDPGHNVVVGKNGSGKSNLFYAMEFLLDDEYSRLDPAQRRLLLHEETEAPATSAYVEIIFDNSDEGLPIDEDEVCLRRAILSPQKDEYYINGNLITRGDVMIFIDQAGFSTFNPYYMIKQQMIDQMATASDSIRLKLLRDVTATRVYDDKRKEVKSIIYKTKERRKKLQKFLHFTEKKLETLEEENGKLQEYQKWDIQRRSLEYIIYERELKENKCKLEELKNSRTRSGEEQAERSADVKKAPKNERERKEKMKSDAKDLEKLASELNRLEQNIKDLIKKITELGVRLFIFPNKESYTERSNMSAKELFEKLEEANSHLKEYSHVSEKALDHFMEFSEQKVKVVYGIEQLDRSGKNLKELMLASEQKKCEAIRIGFKQISKNFSEIFKKLVPTGRAQLVMKIADGDDDETEAADSDGFMGLGIRVSFTEDEGEIKEMNRLSDGQRSLVALAIIFAFQKFNTVPLYWFDEIDQALDQQHRKALADVIHELSSKAQCITTTSRPELLQHANKIYRVELRDEVSYVECVTREQAAEFVDSV